jgi:probable rRNA maturation factor
MDVEVYTSRWTQDIDKFSVKKALQSLVDQEKISCKLIIVHFVSKKKISLLHDEFFQDPTPTDCITFPIDPIGPHCEILGELFICPQVALEYSKKHDILLEEELTLYLVHGFLHLLGYDDIDETQRESMRKKEKSCMDKLKRQNALLRIHHKAL